MNTRNFLVQDALDPRASGHTCGVTLDGATPLIHTGSEDGVDAVLIQRRGQWGDTYKQIAGDWSELLGVDVTDEEFIAMMIVLKLRRWRNSGYTAQDCLTDIIGYAKLGLSL